MTCKDRLPRIFLSPYRFPPGPKITLPRKGPSPSVPLKECRTVAVHLLFAPGDSLKTVPQPQDFELPPWNVVPYKLPVASKTGAASGFAPSSTLKLCRIVSVHSPSVRGDSL